MNNWENMANQYGVPNMMQPLIPPQCIMSEMSSVNPAPAVESSAPLIGPVMPENLTNCNSSGMEVTEEKDVEEKNSQSSQRQQSNSQRDRESKSDRRDHKYDRDRSRRRSRSRDRYRSERSRGNGSSDRSGHKSDRSSRRERQSKWNKPDSNEGLQGGTANMSSMLMMPGMMPYNMINNNIMGQQPMEMVNMPNVGVVPMSGVNMPQNMMDPNMMMLNQQMQMTSQLIYLSVGILLPPLPGTHLPSQREKPPGCKTIFVGGLPNGISEEIITEIFMRFGSISNVKLHHQGVCHVRFHSEESVEQSFLMSGYRFKLHEQLENEATTIFIDYALNRDDQNEYEKNKKRGVTTPPRIESFSSSALVSIAEKIKTDDGFLEVAPTVHGWLEKGECNKKYANQFYSLIQATNNQIRRLFTEKMQLDEEFQAMKSTIKEKYLKVIMQFEQVANILTAAKHQRVSDHFTKQQRRNIEMWLKITEEVDNVKEEFDSYFNEDDIDRTVKNVVSQEKYEELKKQNENLIFELEGYRNEAHLAKDEAERKFEKFKAQFIAQQALQNPKQVYPPLPPLPTPLFIPPPMTSRKPEPPPPTPDDMKLIKTGQLFQNDAKLISVLTAFLLIHPLGASLEYIMSYVRSILPTISQEVVSQILHRYSDLFRCKSTGIGPNIENKWEYVTFDMIKNS